jgi:hypothetical protein
VNAIQKNFFVTSRMVPLVLIGIVLLAMVRQGRVILLILAVPLYYLCFQSALHTEYRYILAIHHFLFMLAGIAIYSAGRAAFLVGRSGWSWLNRSRGI